PEPMLPVKTVACAVLFILVVSCSSQSREKQQELVAADSTALDTVNVVSSAMAFNPEDEFLGLGVPQFGDLDSMIARRKIRALVPYTYIYYYINGKERGGLAFEALNLFEQSVNKQL